MVSLSGHSFHPLLYATFSSQSYEDKELVAPRRSLLTFWRAPVGAGHWAEPLDVPTGEGIERSSDLLLTSFDTLQRRKGSHVQAAEDERIIYRHFQVEDSRENVSRRYL